MALRRRFFGNDAVDVAVAELELAYALIMSGAYDEPVSLSSDAIRILRPQLGDDNALVYRPGLTSVMRCAGRASSPRRSSLLLAAYAKFETPKPVTRGWRRYALAALVRLYEAKGRPQEAAKYRALMDSTLR